MRRSLFLVCLLSSLSLAACGAEPKGSRSGGGADDDDDDDEGGGSAKDGGSKDAGKGKDGGSSTSSRSDGGGGVAPPKMLTPTSESFEKDATDPLPGLAESVGYLRGVIAML